MDLVPVTTRKHFRDFLQVPFNLHKKDPLWVPPLHVMTKATLSKKNPFFKNAYLQSWVAYKNGKPVGRIAGIINKAHNDYHKDKIAFWGFFEAEDCQDTTSALFKQVEQWAKEQGMSAIRGPMNPSTNHECGLQVSGFDTKPSVMMTQNPEYYVNLVEQQGYEKARDLEAWFITKDTWLTLKEDFNARTKMFQKFERIKQERQIRIRTVNMKRFDEEVETIFKIYNDAWENNWGFYPIREEEYRHMAKDLKSIIVPELVYILEVAGEPAAFSVWLPNINQALIHVRDGKLFPTGLLKILWHTKIKKTITQGRIPILGIKKKFQSLRLGAMLYVNYVLEPMKYGFDACEMSWVLEENRAMLDVLRWINAKHYKTYRIYEKELALH